MQGFLFWEVNDMNKKIKVVKVGGSSLATPEKIDDIAKILSKRQEKVVLVVSAMGKTTDMLLNLSKEVNENASSRELDMLLATGEQVSASLMSMALQKYDRKSISLTSFQANIMVEGVHQKAIIKDVGAQSILDYLDRYDFVVVTGFQGINENKDYMTLGRGGSDTSAVALAVTLQCPCEIYTDVSGIYSIDPRRCENAKKLDIISYEEMIELALSGSNVLEPRSVELAYKYQVPLYVGQITNNENGTWIRS